VEQHIRYELSAESRSAKQTGPRDEKDAHGRT
jgi:hypothetical protein